MGVFDRVISSLVSNAVRTTVKAGIEFDDLTSKLKTSCPSNIELQRIINQKDQLSQVLSLVQTNLTSLNSLADNIDKIIPPVSTAINVIKSLPFPVSFPPGAGIPIRLIIKLSDTLENLKNLIQQGKISVKGARKAFDIISGNITQVQNKMNDLNNAILNCALRNGFSGSLGTNTDLTSNIPLNTQINNELEDSLSENSLDPFFYKGWRLILQNDPNNKFSFPRRRVIAKRTSSQNNPIILISNTGSPESEGYSYSSNTQVLVDDIKFQIDNPNWKPESISSQLDDIQAITDEAQNEANTQLEESRRGRVIFYKGFYSNFPMGNPAGYSEGEYPDSRKEGIIDILNPSEGVSSIRVGRGIRLIIYKETGFSSNPLSSNISDDYKVFEHPINAETEYLEIPDLIEYNFNDKVKSFVIQNLKGGTVEEDPTIKLPISGNTFWALKRKSFAVVRNGDGVWTNGPIKTYDNYVNLNLHDSFSSPPNSQNYESYYMVQASDKEEAKSKFNELIDFGDGLWGETDQNSETVIYRNTIQGVTSFQARVNGSNNYGNYEEIQNQYKIYYVEKIN